MPSHNTTISSAFEKIVEGLEDVRDGRFAEHRTNPSSIDLAIGQKWVERCGWWRRIMGLREDHRGRPVVDYAASRGNAPFRRSCSVAAFNKWAKDTMAKVHDD